MTVVDWWVLAAIGAFLTLTIIWDRAAARRQRDVDAEKRARQRLRRELERHS